jgi:hypothetical protein
MNLTCRIVIQSILTLRNSGSLVRVIVNCLQICNRSVFAILSDRAYKQRKGEPPTHLPKCRPLAKLTRIEHDAQVHF